VANTLDYVVPGKAPVSSAYDKLLRNSGLFKDKPSSLTKEEVSAGDAETEKLKRLAAARAQTGQNTNPALQPRPPVAVVKPSGPPGPPKPVVTKPEVEKETKPEAMDPMEVALRAAIMKSLGRNEDQEFEKGSKRYQDFMGLDKLLAPREARITEREGMQRKIQGDRLPSWVEGLDRASKPIVSGGIGTILNNLGSGMRDQSKAYSAEDLKFFDQISDMKDEVLKLKMEGKYKAAAAGESAIKDMLADKRQNESSGTSLLNTQAVNKSREQTALEGRLSREQVAREGRLNRTQASNAQLEAKKDERLQKQRNWVAEQERKWQDTLSRNPDYKKAISMRSMQEQILMASTDPAVQDKAQANIDNLNEKIQKMLPTAGAVNIPPPPKGAVVRTG